MKNENIYRFKVTEWDNDERETANFNGFVVANSYSAAIKKIEELCIGQDGESDIIDIYCMEVDSWDGKGIIDDTTIREIFDEK